MERFNKLSSQEVKSLRDRSFDSIAAAIRETSCDLAEQTGFLELEPVIIADGSVYFATPEQRLLKADFVVASDNVTYENVELYDIDDNNADETRRLASEFLEALDNDDADAADGAFVKLMEGKVAGIMRPNIRLVGNKIVKHKPDLKLRKTVQRYWSTHHRGHRPQSAILKSVRARKKHQESGMLDRLQNLQKAWGYSGALRAAHEAFETLAGKRSAIVEAARALLSLVPENDRKATNDTVCETTRDFDDLMARRRYAVKMFEATNFAVQRKKHVGAMDIIERYEGDKAVEEWRRILECRKKLGSEHKRVAFRSKVESIRSNIALAENEKAMAEICDLAVTRPELIYFTLGELAEQISRVFESFRVKGNASDIAKKIYTALFESNRKRVVAICESASCLFDADESVPEDDVEALDHVVCRLYGTITEQHANNIGAHKKLSDLLKETVIALRKETVDFDESIMHMEEASELCEIYTDIAKQLDEAVEQDACLDYSVINCITDDIFIAAGTEAQSEIVAESVCDPDEIKSMLYDEKFVYAVDEETIKGYETELAEQIDNFFGECDKEKSDKEKSDGDEEEDDDDDDEDDEDDEKKDKKKAKKDKKDESSDIIIDIKPEEGKKEEERVEPEKVAPLPMGVYIQS